MPTTAENTVVLTPSASGPVKIDRDFPFEIMLEERTYKVGSTATFQRRTIPVARSMGGSHSVNLIPNRVEMGLGMPRPVAGGMMSLTACPPLTCLACSRACRAVREEAEYVVPLVGSWSGL